MYTCGPLHQVCAGESEDFGTRLDTYVEREYWKGGETYGIEGGRPLIQTVTHHLLKRTSSRYIAHWKVGR